MTARNLLSRLLPAVALLVAAGALLLRPSAAHADAQPAPTVLVRDIGPARRILTDASGLSLYVHDRSDDPSVLCVDDCTQTFSPLISPLEAPVPPPNLPGMLTVVVRPDGDRQVALNRRPLYRFSSDAQPGDARCDLLDVRRWHLVELPASPSPPDATGTMVLVADTFDDPAQSVLQPPSATGSRTWRSIVNGELVVEKTDPRPAVFYLLVPGSVTATDGTLSVDARMVSEGSGRYIVLGCRMNPSSLQTLYQLTVSPRDCTYRLDLVKDGSYSRLAGGYTVALRAGDAWNHLQLSCVGDAIRVTVNGSELASVRDSSIPVGDFRIGVDTAVEATVEAHFDNLRLTQP